jgi:hypothetical protein
MTENGKEEVLAWRVENLERQLDKLTKDVNLLNRSMYMFLGAVAFVNVVLPLLEKYSGQ